MLPRIIAPLLLMLLPALSLADTARYQGWLQEMREQPRGPFSRVRWFCNDGTVLPPKAYACQPHGGGVQHGEWDARTLELREQGYLVANFLAGVQAQEWISRADFENTWGQLLIERFLIAADDGWILRRALLYRGAIQEEDERAGARQLLLALLSRGDGLDAHFLSTRTGVKLLPHGLDTASAGRVRQLSAALSETDPAFMPVRIKIHGAPDATDAARVREYLQGVENTQLQERYATLAQEIDAIYQACTAANHAGGAGCRPLDARGVGGAGNAGSAGVGAVQRVGKNALHRQAVGDTPEPDVRGRRADRSIAIDGLWPAPRDRAFSGSHGGA